MAGPLSPAVGGMTTVIEDLSRSRLAAEVDLMLFDIKKRTRQDRSLAEAVCARLRLWREWWNALAGGSTIAHIHTCSGLSYFLDGSLLLLARLRGLPGVLHIHGGRFDQFVRSLPPPAAWLARWIARRAAAVVVLSPVWQERLTSVLPGAHLVVVENGIALPSVPRANRKRGAATVLFLGNLSLGKGVWELLTAVSRLEADCKLVFVGGEEETGIIRGLRLRAAELGIADRVIFAGCALGAEKYAWLAEADVFALPSHAEGLPMSLLEAMSVGLPVVTTPVGAIPSLITAGYNGLLVPPEDVRALRDALENLLRDADLRRRLGNEGQQLVRAHYSVDRAAAELNDLYRRIARRERIAARATSNAAMSNALPASGFEARWRERFERFADEHDDDAGIAGWSASGLGARFRHFCGVWPGARPGSVWVDVGCGAATYARKLAGEGLEVHGLDYSLPTLRKARERSSSVSGWAVADVARLPLRSASVDGALCLGVMQALASPDAAVAELSRVVRGGGHLWVDALNATCLPNALAVGWDHMRKRPPRLRYDRPGMLAQVLRDHGFHSVRIHWIPVMPARLSRFQSVMESSLVRASLKAVPRLGHLLSHAVLLQAQRSAHASAKSE